MSVRARGLTRPPAAAAGWGGLALLTVVLVSLMQRDEGVDLLALVGGLIGAAVLVGNPFVGVLVVFAGWFTRLGVLGYGATLVVLLPLAATIFADRRLRALDALQIRALLGIGALYVLSTWWNELLGRVPWMPGVDETLPQFAIFALRLLFVVFVFYFVTTVRQINVLAWLVVALIGLAALDALAGFEHGGLQRAHAEFGVAGNANRLAHICVFGTALVWFYRCHGGDRRLKTLSLPLLGLLPLVALLTASRSGLLQLGLLTVLAIREQRGWSPARRMRSLVFVGALATLALVSVPSALLTRATTFDRSHVGQGQDSLKNRFNTVMAGLEVIAQDPVLGVGLGNFRSVKRVEHGLPRTESTHNAYLWAVLAGGLGALALYLLLFATTWRVLRHVERHGPSELRWLASGLRVGLILFLLFSAFADFWLSEIFAVIVALPLAMATVTARQARAAAPVPARPTAWRPEPAR